MIVLCEANTGSSLPKHAWRHGESEKTRFSPLKVGCEYVVYGLMFRPNGVDYLVFPVIQDSDWKHGPYWMPGALFKIMDSMLPSWRMCLTEYQPGYQSLYTMHGITALIGYDDLVGNPGHYDGILDRDPEQIQIFFVEKIKIDQWQRMAKL